jgi:hypothetical protein
MVLFLDADEETPPPKRRNHQNNSRFCLLFLPQLHVQKQLYYSDGKIIKPSDFSTKKSQYDLKTCL